MTLDEAIKHCEKVAEGNEEAAEKLAARETYAEKCKKCAEEHRQLAEWLKELKAYREQDGDAISRQAAIDGADVIIARDTSGNNDVVKAMTAWKSYVEGLPPVTPKPKTAKPKIGRWIYGEDNLGTGRDGWYCNQCGHFEFWDYSSNMKSAKLKLPNPCPNCGAQMQEVKG